MFNFKSEKGSITLFVLASCIFFIASVTCVQMYLNNKERAINQEYKQVKSNYEKNIGKEGEIYENLASRSLEVTFSEKTKNDSKIVQEFEIKNINNDINSIKYGWTKDKLTLPDSWIYVEKDETKVQASKDLTSGDNNTYFLCVSIQTSSNVENFIAED